MIPDSVTLIEEAAFANCENLKSIVIPDSVTKIEAWAFMGCFRSFRPDFLSVFHGEDTIPPQEFRIDCKF